jgi:hypothetical protein
MENPLDKLLPENSIQDLLVVLGIADQTEKFLKERVRSVWEIVLLKPSELEAVCQALDLSRVCMIRLGSAASYLRQKFEWDSRFHSENLHAGHAPTMVDVPESAADSQCPPAPLVQDCESAVSPHVEIHPTQIAAGLASYMLPGSPTPAQKPLFTLREYTDGIYRDEHSRKLLIYPSAPRPEEFENQDLDAVPWGTRVRPCKTRFLMLVLMIFCSAGEHGSTGSYA